MSIYRRRPADEETDCNFSFVVQARRDEHYDVVYRPNLFAGNDPALADAMGREQGTLVVTTPTVDRLYSDALRRYLAACERSGDVSLTVLTCSESQKGMEQVLAVCERAAAAGLARRSRIVSFGGGVLMDVCGLAATLFRRGVPLVRVPTTLIGMIDAGIGVKNGINFGGKKSQLGSFTAPDACIIDPSFLSTLPRRHLRCGVAESLKIALVGSAELFDLLEVHGVDLLESSFREPADVVRRVIHLSVARMLDELDLNLFERPERFERSYARRADFDRTFSPYIEEASRHTVLHGEAVVADMVLSAQISSSLGLLDDVSLQRLLELVRRLEFPLDWSSMDPAAMYAALGSVVKHRDGKLNLVLPTGLGNSTYLYELADLSPRLIDEAIGHLARRTGSSGLRAMYD